MATVSGITTALGIGSGIDTKALVTSLVKAVRDPKQSVITNRQSLTSARISALASASNSLDTFANALSSLLAGTGYSGVPASSDPSIASVSLLPGGVPKGLPAQMEVMNLASARTLVSAPPASSGDLSVGEGQLTLNVLGKPPATITITTGNNSYEGLAAAINAAGLGVTATVVTDTQGTRLSMKGATGASNDFSLASVSGAQLSKFAWDPAMTTTTMLSKSTPLDATIKIDGVEQNYASNTIDNAISNLRIDLNKAAPGSVITLATSEPTTTLRDLMVEYVDAYNTMMKALNTATSTGADSSTSGVLNGESAARDMKRQLSQMTSTALTSTGVYKTLSDIGIATNRDGTIKLDTAVLDKAIAADPAAITQMLNPTVKTAANPGLSGMLTAVRDKVQNKDGALAQAKAKYESLAKTLNAQLEKLDEQMTDYESQLTSVYSKMETRLTALKATQSYLDQQIKVWSGSNNN